MARVLTTRQLIGFLKCNITSRAAGETQGKVARQPQSIVVRQGWQTIMIFVFTVVTTFFLPLIFCTLVCFLLSMVWVFSNKKPCQYFGMNNIKEFHDNPLSRHDFWRITAPICSGIILVAVIITILFGVLRGTRSGQDIRWESSKRRHDIERQ